MRLRATIALLVTGATLLVGAPSLWYLSLPPADVGEVPGAATPTTSEVTPVEAVGGADAASESDGPAPSPPGAPRAAAASAGPAQAAPAAPQLTAGEPAGPLRSITPPTHLTIPAIGVDAPIVPVAIDGDGTMELPTDVHEVGWYEPGARPGQQGTAVLAGHVDSRRQGAGALFDLRSVDPGTRLRVHGADGTETEWEVVARARYAKDELPTDELFVRRGEPRLAIITCGGDFDAETGHYTDNVVVYAVPA